MTIEARSARTGWLPSISPATLALAALLLAMGVGKLVFRANAPLWFDEVWTGMTASQRSFEAFARQCYLDVNAPLGYVIAWLWEPVSGLSNRALRVPAEVFAAITPLVALWPRRALGRAARMVWAALLACWLPGFLFATEARCYSLLLLLATANAAAFALVMRDPRLTTAFGWTASSSLLILTHYLALPLVACQGLAYLLIHRQRAVRTWPSLVAFAPAGASLAAHAALLLVFSGHGPAQTPVGLGDIPLFLEFLAGGSLAIVFILSWAAGCWMVDRIAARRSDGAEMGAPGQAPWIVPLTSIAAVGLCIAVSMAKPLFVIRYLTPEVPGVLLGLALLAQHFARSWRLAPAILVALEFGAAMGLLAGASHDRSRLSFEAASEALMEAHAKSLTFLWDSPSSDGGDPDHFAQIGGFFFRRAGVKIPTQAVIPRPGDDPNLALQSTAIGPGAAILWVYDQDMPGVAADRFPPRLERLDPSWRCRDFGNAQQHVLTCMRQQTGAARPL